MAILKIFNKYISDFKLYCTKAKPKICVHLNDTLEENLKNEKFKPRKHPGIYTSKIISVPENITNALIKSCKDYPMKTLRTDGIALNRYLKARHVPLEQSEMIRKQKDIEHNIFVDMGYDVDFINKNALKEFRKNNNDKIRKLLQRSIYNWKPINFNAYKSLQYAVGRGAQEYSVLFRIFTEINSRHSNYQPNSFFDFGSGIGTGIWAASQLWKTSIHEYFLVDSSRDMNDLSEFILRDGTENKELTLKHVYFRQFLPATNIKFDIVLCAYSLFEIENAKKRLDILLNLWNKCDGYLIIVEHGTRAGFSLINEARDFILNISKDRKDAFVFAPCPHDLNCPRYLLQDGTPCNFSTSFKAFPFYNLNEPQNELYSYVVIKKGKREMDDISQSWPRLIRPTLKRSKHTICRMCTMKGNLQEIIFTQAKFGKLPYQCARASKLGDLLPIEIE